MLIRFARTFGRTATQVSAHLFASSLAQAILRKIDSHLPRLPSMAIRGVSLGVALIAPVLGAELNLSWTDNSPDEIGFKIERSSDGVTFSQIATVAANTTSYRDSTVASGTYWYRVCAYSSTEISDYTNTSSSAVTSNSVLPTFTTQPVSQSFTPGSTVSFTVNVTGTPTPSLQWYRNGVAMSGNTSTTLTLVGLTTNDIGTYVAVATNSAGSASSTGATLSLSGPTPVAPSFTTQPVSLSVTQGGTASFVVGASGTPTPALQWYRNGAALSGATAARLTLTNVSNNDIGIYVVVATNSSGSVTSSSGTLTVNAATPVTVDPVIVTQPTNQVATQGTSVSFNVGVTGLPAPTLQWYRNGVMMNGATSATLTLVGLTTNDIGTYVAVATNTVGSVTSSGATLSVNPITPTAVAPTFTSQPASQSITQGNAASLTGAANGTPTPTYQWYKNGNLIIGAVDRILYFQGTLSTDAGNYTLTASNSAGTVTSNVAVLAVQPAPNPDSAPAIATQPVNQFATAGGNSSFTVSATGSPSPTYQWAKNGVAIPGATSASLSLTNVTANNTGSYTVTLTNRAGATTSNPALLTVTTPSTTIAPSIVTQPVSQSVIYSANVAFTVSATGSPSPTYQWRKDNVAIPGATSPTLMLGAVTPEISASTYSVVVTNAAGSVTSVGASLTVGSLPSFTVQPVSQVVSAGSAASFTVSVSGSPTPTVQWRKNGVDLVGATSTTLNLANVTSLNAGTYTVVASNSSGSTTSAGAVLAIPSAVTTAPAPAASTVSTTRLANVSVRAVAGEGAQTLIVGFVVTQANKSVMLRAVGPGLAPYTGAATFVDPQLSLFKGSSMVMTNDNWGGTSALSNAFSRLGAFPLAATSKDAALLATLTPDAYTAQINGTGAAMTLVEVYDADDAGSGGRLVNLAARAQVGSGDNVLITGFVVTGSEAKQVLIRAIGPTLSSLGVTGVLEAPQVDLYKDGTLIQHNEAWGGSTALSDTFAQVGAFPLADRASKDAAMVVTLAPGAYTAIVSGAGGSTGVALVEVYDVK